MRTATQRNPRKIAHSKWELIAEKVSGAKSQSAADEALWDCPLLRRATTEITNLVSQFKSSFPNTPV